MTNKLSVRIKRVYEPADPGDGKRILIDRLWPRGLTKDKARIDLWEKEIAPSSKLRKWFNHDPVKWSEFQKRYQHELDNNNEAIGRVRKVLEQGSATLVYSAKDQDHNDAVVLKSYLES